MTRALVIAHRGASAYAPENTLAAFRLALEQGADGIELDAKLTADGEIVVIHDATVTRTTGAPGKVRNLTLAALRRLDAGSYFSPQFAGERIPTLEEVFQAVGGRLRIDIEITNYARPWDGLAGRIATLVQRYVLQEQVFFSSFLPHNLLTVRRRLPGTPAGLLALQGAAGWLSRGAIGRWVAPELILPYYTDVSAQSVVAAHRAGRRVIPWTVNATEDARRLLGLGVDGIITDDPRMVRTLRDSAD